MTYRPDVDGLRAVAVLSVLLFHAGIAGFGGGFVGVDVFFVISGYLITGIIAGEIRQGTFSIAGFYERRIRRIFPALFAVVAFVAVAAAFLFMSTEFRDVGQSVVAATLFVSNLLFWWETDYFDGSAELKPLLHTWSLSVEEQFYIVFPLFLAAVHRWAGGRFTAAVLPVALGSFALALWGMGVDASATFYQAPTRAWELLIGSLLALGAVPALRGRGAREAAGVLGLALVAWPVLGYSAETPFPGLAALPPCLGAALLIHAGQGDAATRPLATRLLSARPMVAVGLISFSLYLWHWPLLVFARYLAMRELTALETAGIVALTFAAAWASWRWVEQPFRHRTPILTRPRLFAGATAVMASATAAGVAIAMTGNWVGLHWRQEGGEAARLVAYGNYPEIDGFSDPCFLALKRRTGEFSRETCLAQDPARRDYLLIGDSHAAHWWPGLERTYRGVNFPRATAAGCRPLLDRTTSPSPNCAWMNAHLFREYIPGTRPDGVILAGRWEAADLEALPETIRFLKEHAGEVVLVGPVAEYFSHLPYFLARDPGVTRAGPDAAYMRKDRAPLDGALRRLAAAEGVRYVSFMEVACPGGACELYAAPGVPMQWDYGHLTLEGAALLAGRWKDRGLLPLPEEPATLQVTQSGDGLPGGPWGWLAPMVYRPLP
ncbi:MAG TPA: acyltransferase family protein [Azospirillaceae bacterium]|nr:acyltransferase family protein [Azospirillaceae bacterium]